jgi:hypothetical protein
LRPKDLPGDEKSTIAALLTGGNPRGLRNAGIVIDAASRRPERLEELVQCVFSADEIVRMRASDALEKVCRSRPALLQPFVPRLLGEMSRIEQASVQWHLAQILTEVRLDDREQAAAIAILEHNLDTSGDWIVINLTLQALAMFARTSPAVRTRLTRRLHHYQDSPYKSVASRARKLLAELGSEPPAGKTRDLPRTPEIPLGRIAASRNPPSKASSLSTAVHALHHIRMITPPGWSEPTSLNTRGAAVAKRRSRGGIVAAGPFVPAVWPRTRPMIGPRDAGYPRPAWLAACRGHFHRGPKEAQGDDRPAVPHDHRAVPDPLGRADAADHARGAGQRPGGGRVQLVRTGRRGRAGRPADRFGHRGHVG